MITSGILNAHLLNLIFKESGVLSSYMQSFNCLHAFSTVLQLIQPSIDFNNFLFACNC